MTSVHPYLDVRIFRKECCTLKRAGYDVVLIAPDPEVDCLEGVELVRSRQAKSPKIRFLLSPFLIFIAALRAKANIFHFHDPELIPAGILLRILGKSVIYDVHEDLPRQIFGKKWIPDFLKRIAAGLVEIAEWCGGRLFTRVIAVTPTIAKRFPGHKVHLVQNYPILEEFLAADFLPYQERPNRFIYVGGLTEIRGVREMVNAMQSVSSSSKPTLALLGNFNHKSFHLDLAEGDGWSFVDFLGWQKPEFVLEQMGSARAGFVLFHPLPNHVNAQPNKLFEYMAAGLPVIASDFPLWREIVNGSQCGLLVDPHDVESIAKAATWILENSIEAEMMGIRGQRAVVEKFNWMCEKIKLLKCYQEIVEDHPKWGQITAD